MTVQNIASFCLLVTLLDLGTAFAFECKVCHSKNPKMVAMHRALEGQNCFGCHKVGDKLMGKGATKDLGSQLKRRVSEAECRPCHGKQE